MRIHCTDDGELPIMDFASALDRAQQSDETVFNPRSKESTQMATKKAPQAAAPAPAAAAPAPAKKTKGAAAPAPAPEPEGEAESGGPRGVPEGHTGLAALAEELGTTPAAMRRKLRGTEGMAKPEGAHGWYWKDGSKELAAVRKLFTPEPEAATK